MIQPSSLDAESARYRKVVPAGRYWIEGVRKGETFRIVDLEGNQAVDTLFYNDDEEQFFGLRSTGPEVVASDGVVLHTERYLARSGSERWRRVRRCPSA